MENNNSPQRSPLNDLYPPSTPFMEFGGWEMPRDFGGIVEEHNAVRNDLGVFDLSHMGRLVVSGENTLSEVNSVFTRQSTNDSIGRALYGFFCDEDGGCLDDAIVYVKNESEVWMVVNAANRIRIKNWLESHLKSAQLTDVTHESVLLAIQGPNAPEYIRGLGFDEFPAKPFRASWDSGGLYATTGYTGEAGGELWLPIESGRKCFSNILEKKSTLCGLGARDTLRLEKGFALHGHELSQSLDPVTAGFDKFIDWNHEFIGKNALRNIKENGPSKRLTGIKTGSRQSPREGYALRTVDGSSVGEVTSGRFSPSLNEGIGMCLVNAELPENQTLELEIRNRWIPVEQKAPPFV